MMLVLAVVHSASLHPDTNTLACTYSSRLDNDTLQHEHCAWRDRTGRLHVYATHLRRLDYDKFGLSTVFIDKFYYVRRNGRVAPTMAVDNWAEDFQEGLARSPVNGKIGYIDRSLTLRIPAKYDGAYPFYRGFAVVCVGCTSRSQVSKSGELEGSWYEGGVWACIDRLGHPQPAFRAPKPNVASDAICPNDH
jgi:hypothetical protein